jgi:hypothetical protein
MGLGKLEPLYRYLKTRNKKEPVASMLSDIETLAKGGYVRSLRDGILEVIETSKAREEVDAFLRSQVPKMFAYTMSYQAIGKSMYCALNRVAGDVSKTSIAFTIQPNDTVTVEYLEADVVECGDLSNRTLYNSISTLVVQEDGSVRRGFLRAETMIKTATNKIAMKIDFKIARSVPFYVVIDKTHLAQQSTLFGPAAKAVFEAMEPR